MRIAREIAEGIEFLHSCNVVHRDLKPKNILLDANNVAKITDLGISRLLENAKTIQN